MRLSIVWTIFRKELLETLRDRRTLVMMIGVPLLLYPLMIIFVSKLQESQEEAREARTSQVAIWGEVSSALLTPLQQNPWFSLKEWEGASSALRQEMAAGKLRPMPPLEAKTDNNRKKAPPSNQEAENPVLSAARMLLGTRQVDAVLVIWPGFDSRLQQGGMGILTVYFDSVRQDSAKARERLEEALENHRKQIVALREKEHHLEPGFAKGVEVSPRNVASQSRRFGLLLGSLLPFMLIIISTSSGLYAAIDLTAGEKERNTMQTLLCAPVSYPEIIAGKFLTVWIVGLLASLVNIVSMAATFTRLVEPEGLASLSPSLYVMAFIMLIPVSLTITALFLAIAVFAKDFKDGQNFLTPVIVILMLPLSTTLIPGIELNAWTAFVPVVNIALLIKALFLAEAKTDLLFLTLASSSAYGTLALLFAARVFEREQVLLGGKESLGQILKFERKKDSSPSPAMALTTFCLVFVLIFYGSLLLKNTTLITALLTTEYLFFLLPALSLSWLAGHSFRNTYHLAWPDWRGILGSLLIGCSAWAGIGGLATRLFPPPESLVRSLSKLVQLGDQPQPLWVLWLVIGLTPALCEEFFFRGLVLSGLKRWGMVGAVCTSGLLFGLAHSSIYRLLPTLVLGLLLGYAVWRTRSIVTSILIHVLNNGLVATLVVLSGFQPGSLDWKNMKFLPWSWTLAGLAVTLAGVVLLRLAPSSEEKASNRTHP